jgi:hypothetical protein
MAQYCTFRVGDLVTREGTDLHRVLSLTEDSYAGEFECVQAPETGWCKVGDIEHNVTRRYAFASGPLPAIPAS